MCKWVFLCEYLPHVCQCLWRPEEDVRSSETGGPGGCEMTHVGDDNQT